MTTLTNSFLSWYGNAGVIAVGWFAYAGVIAEENCGFFRWEEGVNTHSSPQIEDVNVFKTQPITFDIQLEKRMMEEKIKKLCFKNQRLKGEVQQLKNEVCELRSEKFKCSRIWKKYSLCLTISFFMFSIVLLFLK
ncbi:unnamed protein product [Cuscuta epithymum]|uniref:Uncharacterized protein n=1 Tax=Cuscuta epithymum TaxID=186058 RepID=A0AAV0DT21_9ASTE|nr:unnamed protein product [Cuscuta epithymum]